MSNPTATAEEFVQSIDINWKSLFTCFEGRIDRKTFWIGFGFVSVASAILQAIVFSVVNYSDAELVSLVASVTFAYPLLAVGAKRCHDRNKSGLWQVIYVLQPVGFIWMVYELGYMPSIDEDNMYGRNVSV